MDLVGDLRVAFQQMKARTTAAQFSYVATNLVHPNEKVGAARECSSCHLWDVADTRKAELVGAATVWTAVTRLQPLLTSGNQKKDLAIVRAGLEDYASLFGQYMDLVGTDRFDDAHKVLQHRMLPLVDRVDEALDQLRIDCGGRACPVRRGGAGAVSRSQSVTIILISVSLMVTCGVLTMTRRSTRGLRRMVAELAEGAEQVAVAASQVSSSGQALAQGSSEQAASLEETSASSEEINSMARRNSESSRDAADLVTRSQEKFAETNRSLDQMVLAMGEINTQSGKISKIIKVIDEIAFQTNILALNAAVEAARAGESGMGFAVVADEVRNLAQRSAQAARDTAGLIEESIARSNSGQITVDQVAADIRSITAESAKVKTLVDEVSLGSAEQSRGIDQIGRAILQMEQVTQKTAATAGESASASEELNAQSEMSEGSSGAAGGYGWRVRVGRHACPSRSQTDYGGGQQIRCGPRHCNGAANPIGRPRRTGSFGLWRGRGRFSDGRAMPGIRRRGRRS